MASIIYYFGPENWRYAFYLGIIISVPVLTFWVIYSTRQRYDEFHDSCIEHGFTPPTENAPIEAQSENKKQAKKGLLKKTLKSRGILFTAGSTLITHIVYLGFLTIFPAYLYNIVGLNLAEAAGLSAVFTITGIMGQIFWPSLSDKIGRRKTLILCG